MTENVLIYIYFIVLLWLSSLASPQNTANLSKLPKMVVEACSTCIWNRPPLTPLETFIVEEDEISFEIFDVYKSLHLR